MDIIDCAQYQHYCDDENWANSMEYYCSATCGFCEGNTTFINLNFHFLATNVKESTTIL